MAWTVNWMYMILMTSLTGGVFTLIWYGVSRALEWTGYLNITYKMLKVILVFWYCPFMYYLLLYMDRYTAKWGGWLFAGTPAILRFSKVFTAVWLFRQTIVIPVQEYSEEQLQIVLKHELAINTDNLYSNIVNK